MTGRSRARRGVRRAARWAVGLVAVLVAFVTGAVITGVFASGVGAGPAPTPRALSGQPVVESVAVGHDRARIVIVPHRPGRNLVWIDGDGYGVRSGNGTLVPAGRRLGAAGSWAVIDLPAGPSTLRIQRGDAEGTVQLNAESSVPNLPALLTDGGPECLSAVVGATIAGAPPPARCPDQRFAPADRAAIRGMLRSIAERKVPGIRLVGGDTPRADAAERLVRREAGRLGLTVNGERAALDARVVVGDWAAAERTLERQVRDPAGSGVYLAPWLGNGKLLGYSSGAVVVLNYDTTAGAAAQYVAALDRFAVRTLASPAGFAAWLAATRRPVPSGPARLYAGLAGFTMMGVDLRGHDAGVGTGGWIPNGRLTPVSGPLDTS